MKNKINKKTIITISAVLVLLVLIGGVSFAFFSASSISNSQTITSGELSFTFDDSTPIINSENMIPLNIDEILTKATKKSFSINSISATNSQYISLYLKDINIDSDLKSIDFMWALYENNKLIIDSDFSNINDNQILIKNNLKLDKNSTRNFDLYIWVQDNGEAQNYMQGKSFSAKIYAGGLVTKTSEYYTIKNLFNNQTTAADYCINYKNGNLMAYTSFKTSDYIEVKGNTYYSAGYVEPSGVYYVNGGHYAFYDENKVFISGQSVPLKTVKTPINARYIKFDMYKTPSPSSLGVTLEDPSRYTVLVEGKSLPNQYVDYNGTENVLRSWYEDKVIAAYGDSITRGGNWYRSITSQLSIDKINNFGVSGRRITGSTGMCQDSQIATLPNNLDVLFVMGGTNDWSQSAKLGDINSSDTNTFYGALNVMIQKLQNKYPDKLIILLSTPYGEHADDTDFKIINHNGLTTIDYSNAVKSIASKYNLNVVDLSNLWDTTNLTTYTADSIHPNYAGGVLMGNRIVEILKQIEPDN